MSRRRLAAAVALLAVAVAVALVLALVVFGGSSRGPFRVPALKVDVSAATGALGGATLTLTRPAARWSTDDGGRTGPLSADAVVRLWGVGRTFASTPAAATLTVAGTASDVRLQDARAGRDDIAFDLASAPGGVPPSFTRPGLAIAAVPTAEAAAEQAAVIAPAASVLAGGVPLAQQGAVVRRTFDRGLGDVAATVAVLEKQIRDAPASSGQDAKRAKLDASAVPAVDDALRTARNAVGSANPDVLAALTQRVADRLAELQAGLVAVSEAS